MLTSCPSRTGRQRSRPAIRCPMGSTSSPPGAPGARRDDGPVRDRREHALDLVAGRALRRRRGRLFARPRGERRRPLRPHHPSRPLRLARLTPTARRRRVASRRSSTATTRSASTACACSPTSAACTSVTPPSTRSSRNSTGVGADLHPSDVTGVLGAHVVRSSPTDDRVPVRHDQGDRQHDPQRHDRPTSRTSRSSFPTSARPCR